MAIACQDNERVESNACVACAPGTLRAAGDLATGEDTTCEAVFCEQNERVDANTCVACVLGSTREMFDDASGADTMCAPTLCGVDEFVQDHVCTPCTGEQVRRPGDDATGEDTACVDGDACYAALGLFCDAYNEAYIKPDSTVEDQEFGRTIALSGDTLVVGSPNEDFEGNFERGAVRVFTRAGTTWSQVATLQGSDTDIGDNFGSAVAIEGDTIVVGVPDAKGVEDANANGAVYIFSRQGGAWTQTSVLKPSRQTTSQFGATVALHGDVLLVGDPGDRERVGGVNPALSGEILSSGAAYIFAKGGEGWTEQAFIKAPAPTEFANMGIGLAVHGSRCVIGASGGGDGSAGIAYVYERTGDMWSLVSTLEAQKGNGGDGFGRTLDIEGDLLVVGVGNESSGSAGVDGREGGTGGRISGAVFMFERQNSGMWTQLHFIKAPVNHEFDNFGSAVALQGDTLVIGASGDDDERAGVNTVGERTARDSGAVYVMTRDAQGVWTTPAKLKASFPGAEDRFGSRIALDQNTLAIGAFSEDSAATGVDGDQSDDSANNSGAVYVRRIAP